MSAYKKLRIKFLTDRMCEARLDGCSLRATDVHHKKGRIGDNMLDTTYWLGVCRTCHNWIENHPNESYEMGFSIKRID